MTRNAEARAARHGLHLDSVFVPVQKDVRIMALSHVERQTLIEATRKHRQRCGLDQETGKITNTITRRSVLAAVFASIASRVKGKRDDK